MTLRYSGADFLYRSGDMPEQMFVDSIKRNGIKKIVSLDQATGGKFSGYLKKHPDLKVEHVMLPLNLDKISAERLAREIESNGILNNSPNNRVLVHCKLGRDRTGLAVALYKVIKGKTNCKQAIQSDRAFENSSENLVDFYMTICEECNQRNANHEHYCKKFLEKDSTEVKEDTGQPEVNQDGSITVDTNKALDAAEIVRKEFHHQKNSPYHGTIQPAIDWQLSFAPFSDPDVDRYPGIVDKRASDNRKSKRKARVKFLMKILEDLLKKEDSNESNVPVSGEIDNYNGIPDSFLNAPSGAGGSPSAGAFVDPGGTVQI